MREHFAEADLMQRGLVAGDLDATKRAAAHMAGDEWSPRLKAEWRPYVDSMRAAASRVASSDGVLASAKAFAVLANTCAQCHVALGLPKTEQTTAPPGQATNEMALHAQASKLMWWGLSMPSEEAWMNGAAQLSVANLGSDVPRLQALQQHVTDLAKAGRTIATSERGELYAKTIATCAACHREVNLHFELEPSER
jgi:hypothetical protein